MADIKKVTEGLEAIREFFGFGLPSQSPTFEAYQNILTTALALLKEQETIKPKTGHWIWLQYCANEGVYCSECHTKIFDRYPIKKKLSQFCGHCGAKMDDEVEGR